MYSMVYIQRSSLDSITRHMFAFNIHLFKLFSFEREKRIRKVSGRSLQAIYTEKCSSNNIDKLKCGRCKWMVGRRDIYCCMVEQTNGQSNRYRYKLSIVGWMKGILDGAFFVHQFIFHQFSRQLSHLRVHQLVWGFLDKMCDRMENNLIKEM